MVPGALGRVLADTSDIEALLMFKIIVRLCWDCFVCLGRSLIPTLFLARPRTLHHGATTHQAQKPA